MAAAAAAPALRQVEVQELENKNQASILVLEHCHNRAKQRVLVRKKRVVYD